MAIVRGGAYGGIIPTKRIFELVDERGVNFTNLPASGLYVQPTTANNIM